MRAVFIMALGFALPASAQQDAIERGEWLYAWCYSCHSVLPGDEGLQGPNLFGIVDSPAAARADFPYSDALIKLAEDGIVWDADILDTFLTDPLLFAPGNTMDFFGVPEEQDRADLIAYLISVSRGN